MYNRTTIATKKKPYRPLIYRLIPVMVLAAVIIGCSSIERKEVLFENGALHEIQFYENGLEDSTWYTFWPNGNVHAVTTYHQGEIISQKSWKRNGELFWERNRDTNVQTIVEKAYRTHLFTVDSLKKDGKSRIRNTLWTKSGQLDFIKEFKDEENFKITYFNKNERIRKITYYTTDRYIYRRDYYRDGQFDTTLLYSPDQQLTEAEITWRMNRSLEDELEVP